MCLRKSTPVPITSKHVFLGFGINDYQGSDNDLRGCRNDIEDEIKKLKREFPEFQCLKYFDSQVTTRFFVEEVQRVMSALPSDGFLYIKYSGHGTQIPTVAEANKYNEALYLYNGPLVDDEIYKLQQQTPLGQTVLAKFDSCFSGDIGSRAFCNPGYRKARFMPLQGVPLMYVPVNRLAKTDDGQRWIIMSGCGEEQTSADAMFNGRANGAFTYYDLQSYFRGTLYLNELSGVRKQLFNYSFSQRPELSGPYEFETFLK
jgi:hypothetical protein